MTLCRILVWAFALLWALAVFLLAVGTFGWFGQPRDPLSGIFLVPLGSPWLQLTGKIGVSGLVVGILMPGINLLILTALCRRMTRR